MLTQINAELDKMSPDGSELRAAFDVWIRREINRMETDPARAANLGTAIRHLAAHETVQAWVWDIWSRLQLALVADLDRPNSRTVAYVESALGNLGEILETDPGARARLEAAAEAIVRSILPSAQVHIAGIHRARSWAIGTPPRSSISWNCGSGGTCNISA